MFDLENLNPSTRFFWPESKTVDPETGAISHDEWVDLRLASDDDTRTMRQKIGIKEKIEHIVNPETRVVNRVVGSNVDEIKAKQYADAITDFCIVGWRLISKDGAEIPCTRENKLKLANGSPVFAPWLEKCLNSMREGIKSQMEDEIKN